MVAKLPLNPVRAEIFAGDRFPADFYASVFVEVNYKYFCAKIFRQQLVADLIFYSEMAG